MTPLEPPGREKPDARRRIKGLAIAAALVLLIVVAIFVGYNSYYLATAN